MFVLMIRPPPMSTRTDTLVPYTTLFRSGQVGKRRGRLSQDASPDASRPRPVRRVAPGRLVGWLPSDVSRPRRRWVGRSEEHTSEHQSLMRTSYAVFCLKKKIHPPILPRHNQLQTHKRTPLYSHSYT